jgi:hypothetical protein
MLFFVSFANFKTAIIIHKRNKKDQEAKSPVPTHIKIIARDEKKILFSINVNFKYFSNYNKNC